MHLDIKMMDSYYIIIIILLSWTCLTQSCTLCEWQEWTETGPCTQKEGGEGQVTVRRQRCCMEMTTECALKCGTLTEEKNITCRKSVIKRSIGSSAKKCVPVDIMFVMDESGSISSSNFDKMLVFAEDLVQELNIGTGEAMIAFLTFAYSTRVHFDFNDYSTKTDVINAIKNVDYSSGGTNTADALSTARTRYSSTYGKRSNALSLAIVLTDGESNDKASTKVEAQKLLDHGVTVYCIGIGSNLDEDELKAIASNPNDHYLISSTDFDELTNKITGLVGSLCINDVIPTFMTCHMEIQDDYGEIAQSTHASGSSSECKNQQDFYGKYQVHYASTQYEVDADVSGLTAPTSASDFAYGITDAKVQMIKKSISGSETYLGEDVVKSDPNTNRAPDVLLHKDINMTTSHTLVDGERFCLRYIADAGGYVEYNGKNYTYAKTKSQHDLCYYFDDVAPKHCKDTGTCSNDPVILSNEITRDRDIEVSFTGWFDPIPAGATAAFASGIKSYELYLYEMVDGAPGQLKMDTTNLIGTNKCQCSSFSMLLPNSTHPALYAVVLEVVDIALNPRHARRFVFRDDVSKIAVHTHNTFGASSATNVTGHDWQINHGNICFQWKDRFYNDKMVHFNPLNPIETDPHNHFQGIYESTNGAISKAGTPNVHGITDFYYSLYRDNLLVVTNETISNFERQSLCLLPSVTSPMDGQTFVFRLLMRDLVSHWYTEDSTVYIDASNPEITDIWLTKEGRHQLFVHDSTDLTRMELIFTALDIHSGLYSVQWFIGTSDDSVVFGEGALGVHRLATNEPCPSAIPECYCPSVGVCHYRNFSVNLNSLIANNTHLGNHNRRYFFEVKVINIARLVTLERVNILVDESPPEVGVVKEGSPESVDIDYTSQQDLLFHWEGFIDHESGIKFYQIAVADTCMTSDNISLASTFQELDGAVSDYVVRLPKEGKYYVTVIAYNHAVMPSRSVCSDGITFDTSPPVIHNVTLQNAKIPMSKACYDGESWIVGPRGSRVKDNTSYCNFDCINKQNLDLLRLLPEDLDTKQNLNCEELFTLKNMHIYLPDDHIHLYWNVSENESQLARSYVGIGSNPSTAVAPDIMAYEDAKHLTFYKKHHVGLGNGDVVYIFIKAINRANVESTVIFGPLVVDQSKPVCMGKPTVKVDNEDVTVTWDNTVFTDTQQVLDIGIIHHRIGNGNGYLTPLSSWHISNNSTCKTGNQNCVTYKTNELQRLHPETSVPLFVSMYAENYAGFQCSLKTENFHLPSILLPSRGNVFDVMDPVTADASDHVTDIDLTDTPGSLCIMWRGFEHEETLSFMVGVGTHDLSDDVISFQVPSHGNWHCFSDNSLSPYVKYYPTLKVTSSAGSILHSSDGITIIDNNNFESSLEVFDGFGCDTVPVTETIHIKDYLDQHDCLRLNVSQLIHIGQTYTLFLNSTKAFLSEESEDVIISINQTLDNGIEIIPLVHYPVIKICNPTNQSTYVDSTSIKKCSFNLDNTGSSNHVAVNWRLDENLWEYVSHFEVRLMEECPGNNCVQDVVPYFNAGKRNKAQISHIYLKNGRYKFGVRTCFTASCTKEVTSDGFLMQSEHPRFGIINGNLVNIQVGCTEIDVRFEEFQCPLSSEAIFYRWLISSSALGTNVLTNYYRIKKGKVLNSFIEDSQCVPYPIHPQEESYLCVEGFCRTGTSSKSCVPLTTSVHPNNVKKDVVYDLDSASSLIDEIEEFKHSLNIGDRLKDIANAELDYAGNDVRLSGYILGAGERNITWYLMMKAAHVPTNLCTDDPDCLSTTKTFGGLVSFGKVSYLEGTIYYICSHSKSVTLIRELHSVDLPEITLCSDGVLIDNISPSMGTVLLHTETPGFLSTNELAFSWDGFDDSHKYIDLGYPSPIAHYEYGVGTFPEHDDTIAFSTAELSNGMVLHNVTFVQGSTYFVSLRATDHNGNSVIAVSESFVYDTTAPEIGNVVVGTTHVHQYFQSGNSIQIHISDLHDKESGINKILSGIGSTPNSTDVVPLREINGHYEEIQTDGKLLDGHIYFVIVLVENHAGLSSKAVSNYFIYDSSPPSGGLIRDGSSDSMDANFVTDTSFLTCNWAEFYDHESKLHTYSVALGTHPGSSDKEDFIYVGLNTQHTWKHRLQQGIRYYCVVKACNTVGLCIMKSSNGVVIDGSKPVTGKVHVGMSGKHSKFISSSSYLEVQWFGFEDPQSGIRHFDACIGTARGRCDVVTYINTIKSTYLTFSDILLPVNEPLYVTVRATNYAGLSAESSSESFQVDDTPPIKVRRPEFGLRGIQQEVSLHQGYQWDRSQIGLAWEYKDENSSVVSQFVTLRSHQEGHTNIENVPLTSEKYIHLSFKPDDFLKEGDTYQAYVTACNAAGLCTSSYSEDLFLDHTPPHLGQFTFPMTWSNDLNSIHLQWQGIIDAESGVSLYYLGIGSTYSGSEISDGVQTAIHVGNKSSIQNLSLNISRPLVQGETIYLSIKAENNVGLHTPIARIAVEVVSTNILHSEGTLEHIKHSCTAEYCNRDCTCATVGGKCDSLTLSQSCVDLTASALPLPTFDVRMGLGLTHQNFSSSTACLSASWEMLENLPNKDIKRYEWSFGLHGAPLGSGIFEIHEPVWYDNGLDTSVIHCVREDKYLSHNHRYVAYVKVWFSQTDSAQYSSAPMTIDSTPPSVRRGKFIKDSDASCSKDVEFITSTDSVTACWQNVFSDTQSGILKYTVFIGTQPGGEDFILPQEVGLSINKSFTNLAFELGTKYYITVEAENGVGMVTAHSSDGFVVDTEKPVPGVVFTSDKYHDNAWSASTSELAVSWLGFLDLHSYIRMYMVAVAKSDVGRTIVSGGFVDVNIRNTHHFSNLNFQTSSSYVVLVKAVDAAGLESEIAESIPFMVDATEPTAFTCNSEIRVMDHLINISRSLSWTKYDAHFERETYYRLHITLNGQFNETEPTFWLNKISQKIPFIYMADGSCIGEVKFHPLEDGVSNISVSWDNVCRYAHCMVNISLFKCVQKLDDSVGVHLIQIAPNRISVEASIHDPESGIKSLYVGVGTTKGGFQVRPLLAATSMNHLTVDLDLPHRSPLYSTVLAENHAGLRSSFSTADALILDHTPPAINNPRSTVTYDAPGTNGKHLVTVKLSWEVLENESRLKKCACAFGTEKGLTNLQEKIDSTGVHSDCSSASLEIRHGEDIYPSIFCVNTAELENVVHVEPSTMSIMKPNATSSTVSFAVNNVKLRDHSHVQTYKSSLHFYWDFFHDISGVRSYKCRITSGQTVISNWTNIGGHNYISYENLNLVNGNQYTAEVVATNVGGRDSDVITANIDINEIVPVLTGNVTELKQSSTPGLMSLSWSQVFDLDVTLLPRFIVTVGTMEGFSDVLRSIHTDKYQVVLTYPDTAYKLYVVLRCQYITGTVAVFREEKKLSN